MKDNSKLKGKDLINIGIYGAIYAVLMTAVSMTGFVPMLLPLIGVFVPIVCGIPMMLFMTKVKKFGMVSIMGILFGIFLWITGMGYWPFIFSIVCSIAADLICKSGDYKSSKKTIIANGVFSMMFFGNLVPLYTDIEGYFSTRQGFGVEYMEEVTRIMQPWTAPVLLVAGFVAGIIGALIGMKLLKKHFIKAGIA